MQARFPGATSRRNRCLCQSWGSEWPVLGVGGTSFSSDVIALAVRVPRASRDMLVSHRSTKGASKARRDHINCEIRSMRALLPIPLEDQERLSYLHSMSAICTFIRKSIFFRELQPDGSSCFLPYEDFLQALPGFILVTSREGKLIYVSENVADYLGYSMVDVLQGDAIYDMVDNADVEIVKSNLETEGLPAKERTFVCRMLMSKAFRLRHGSSCSMLVRGRFQAAPRASPSGQEPDLAFVALCTPTADRWRDGNPRCSAEPFRTLHGPDMSFAYAPESLLFHLGYSAGEVIGRSWYSLLHPDDLSSCASKHKSLLEGDEGTLVEMVLRLQHKNLYWVWLYVRATKDSGKQEVSCMNYIVSETEASFLKQRIYSDASITSTPLLPKQPQPSHSDAPQCHGNGVTKVLKREREACCVTEEPQPKTSRVSETNTGYLICTNPAEDGSQQGVLTSSTVFPATPPYSPASSHSPATQEDCPSDFLLDAYSYAETLLSSPESSPPYLSGQNTFSGVSDCFPASDPLQAAMDPTFGLHHFAVAQSPESCPSPSYEFPSCPVGSHLVPDGLQGLDVADGSSDCAFHPDDLGLSTPPPGGDSPFLVRQDVSDTPVLTPDPSPATECRFQYSERERAEISILAQQISSLANSFDTYRSMGLAPGNGKPTPLSEGPVPPCDCPDVCSHPSRLELILDEGVIYSILQDLDTEEGHVEDGEQSLDASISQASAALFTALVWEPSLDQFPSMHPALDPCLVRPGCQEDGNELHQLSRYLHSSLQQDELAEESMY
ncbi:neuronal PAS domain-containing protein 4-like isoform X2 [Paramormyrops kingsleyae]|uniref:neuronal PAS domain-containing protein 4-like isoform X2 n=1 Tax=Paramormyrops kingsleyae TaxID=1676925 RepID=UPI000CD631F6|nr:neuronal PAS domain-containing protein 4-like isoform X2 [Paramormyrops kingsleyae]